MRTVIASADSDLAIALHLRLRNEPGFEVIASVSAISELAAVSASSTAELFVIDASLAPTQADVQACRYAGPPGSPAMIAILASEADPVIGGDAVIRKGGPPSELWDALRRIRRQQTP
jgi:hypothetical protein